jgi:hypothetical protein
MPIQKSSENTLRSRIQRQLACEQQWVRTLIRGALFKRDVKRAKRRGKDLAKLRKLSSRAGKSMQ